MNNRLLQNYCTPRIAPENTARKYRKQVVYEAVVIGFETGVNLQEEN
jgi:hypothetical protein